MLTRDITFINYDDVEVTKTYYFNLNRPELVDLNLDVDGGLAEFLRQIVAAKDVKDIVHVVKKIIRASVGIKHENKFEKTEQIMLDFIQSPAYEVLFMELATDDEKGADFIMAILPKDLVAEMAQEESGVPAQQDKPVGPPPAPKYLNPPTI